MVLEGAGPPWISLAVVVFSRLSRTAYQHACAHMALPARATALPRTQEFDAGLIYHVRLTPAQTQYRRFFIVTAWLRSQVRVRHSSGQQGRPSPSDLHQFFEREVDLRLSAGLLLRMVDLRLFVCAWLRLPWILPLCVCTNALCAPHDIVFPMLSHASVAEIEYFPLGVPFDAVVPATSTAESNVCSLWEAATMEPKRELIQPLHSDQPLLSEHRQYRCFNVGPCELRRLFL